MLQAACDEHGDDQHAVQWHEGDIFAMPDEFTEKFDAVWEHTILCALQPEERAQYLLAVARSLRSGGVYCGVVWNNHREGGPPFDITPDLLRALIANTSAFAATVSMEPVDCSPSTREGTE